MISPKGLAQLHIHESIFVTDLKTHPDQSLKFILKKIHKSLVSQKKNCVFRMYCALAFQKINKIKKMRLELLQPFYEF